jgi:exoribonuclease R
MITATCRAVILTHCVYCYIRRVEASRSDLTSRTFVAAAITEWPAGSSFPYVNVRTSLGPTGDIEAGTAALLAGEGIREQDFSLEVGSLLWFTAFDWALRIGGGCWGGQH